MSGKGTYVSTETLRRQEISAHLVQAANAINNGGSSQDVATALFYTALAVVRLVELDPAQTALDLLLAYVKSKQPSTTTNPAQE